MAKKNDVEEFKTSLGEGLKYPWNKASRLWNILWILIPILGWFALIGYAKNIVKELIKGQRKEVPSFGDFWPNFKQGVIVFVFLIPTLVALILIGLIPIVGDILSTLAYVFLVPWLVMNLFINETFNSLWEVKKAFNLVFNNVIEYLIAYLKTLIYVLIYSLLSLVLVGIPCLAFGQFYFLTEFYKNHQ